MKRYIKYFVMFIALFLTFNINVNASVNLNTSYDFEFEYNWINVDNKYGIYSQSFKDIFNTIINLDSDYFDISIRIFKDSINNTSGQNEFYINLYPKNTTIKLQFTGQNSNSHFYTSSSTIPNNSYYFTFVSNHNVNYNSNFYETEVYTKFLSCYLDNICPQSYTQYTGGTGTKSALKPLELTYFDSNLTFNNTDSFNLIVNNSNSINLTNYIYYKNVNLIYATDIYNTSSSQFVKNMSFNGINVSNNDVIPSYLDIYNHYIESSITKQSDTQLQTIYSRVPVNNINNYKMTFEFQPYYVSPQEYLQNMGWGFNILVSGRVNHNDNYYTYEDLFCDFNDIQYEYIDNTLKFTFTGIVCDSNVNLFNYDYIYFTLYENYSSWELNKSKEIIGIVLNANYGNYIYRPYSQQIYEYFNDLPSKFSFILSTALNSDEYGKDVSLYSSNDSTFYSAYSMTNLTQYLNFTGRVTKNENIFNLAPSLTTLYLNNQYRNTTDYAYMIYDNDGVSSTDINIFLSSGVIVSFNNNDTYYLYNPNTHVIDDRNISIQYDLDSSSDSTYDLSYIINQINYYIDGLRDKIYDFSSLTQNFYDGIPVYVGGFIYIMFCLICLKQIIKLIKNDNGKE